jgi:hypothetical protein
MKKFSILFSLFLIVIHSYGSGPGIVDPKFLAAFASGFPKAQHVSWIENTGTYHVCFRENGLLARVIYAKDRSFVRLIRYYAYENVPYQVDHIMKKEFPGKKIFGVTEVSTILHDGNAMWIVYDIVIDDVKKWIFVRLDIDGRFMVRKVLIKS